MKANDQKPINRRYVLIIVLIVIITLSSIYLKNYIGSIKHGKKDVTDSRLIVNLNATAIYPTSDISKNSFCIQHGVENTCKLTPENVSSERIIIEVINNGENAYLVENIREMRLYYNDLPLHNGTEWMITDGADVDWAVGDSRYIAMIFNCGDIASMPEKKMKIHIQPYQGVFTEIELTCRDCCNNQLEFQKECVNIC